MGEEDRGLWAPGAAEASGGAGPPRTGGRGRAGCARRSLRGWAARRRAGASVARETERGSRAAAGVAELEVGGVAPPAARRAVGSWGSARWRWRCGASRRARGGAGAALDSPACRAVPAPPGAPRPGGGSGRTALSRERREPGPRLRRRDEEPGGWRARSPRPRDDFPGLQAGAVAAPLSAG